MSVTGIDRGSRKSRAGDASLYPVAIAIGTLVLGLAASKASFAGILGAVGAGALCVLHKRLLAVLIAAGMGGALIAVPPEETANGYWGLIATLLIAAAMPLRAASSLLRIAPATWAVCLVLGAASIAGLAVETGVPADFLLFAGCLCGALLGAGLTRHLAMVDARILAWGDYGLEAVTRDLLLGRITSGMLHDLSQPLNVISMANGNLAYIVEHIDTDETTRKQLLDRVARIATHTENAASILSLFRWFGRNTLQQEADLSVRNALKRAVAATRSNVRYHGIDVELEGSGLDLPLTSHHGRVEMMAVAALLSSLAAYGSPEGERFKGRIVMHARAEPAKVQVEVHCADEQGQPIACKPLDNATLWLVAQVAQEAGGDFRCFAPRRELVQFSFRFEREDA